MTVMKVVQEPNTRVSVWLVDESQPQTSRYNISNEVMQH